MDRMITVKTTGDLPKELVDKVHFQVVDDRIEAVVVTIGDDSIRIVRSDSYGNTLKVLKLQPKKEVTRYRLHGNFLGVTYVCEVFNEKHAAESRANEYESKAGFQESGLTIEEFTDLIDEDRVSI